LIALFATGGVAATFNIQGTNLTVTSNNLQISFRGADVVGIVNQLTGESYLRAPSPSMQLNLDLVQPPTAGLSPVGTWTLSGSTASLSFSDSNRTVSVSVTVDSSTQEVVVDLTGMAQQGGVQQLIWGVTGFDMTVGAFILPGWGGMEINGASFQSQSSYYFLGDQWDAPFSLFQTKLGGLTVFSTDTNALNKDLLVSANQEQTANEWFYVEAQAPLSTATQAGPIEWRLAAYQGGWQVGARIYRDWHNGVAPAVPLTGGRAWVNNIETVIQVGGGHPYQTSDLDSLATVLVPSKTLLYLYDWRDQGYDVGYPDYNWDPSTPAFIAYAHKLGFRVMLHTDVLGVAPTSSDYAAVQQFQLRDPNTLALQGWNWNLPIRLDRPGRIGVALAVYYAHRSRHPNPAGGRHSSRFFGHRQRRKRSHRGQEFQSGTGAVGDRPADRISESGAGRRREQRCHLPAGELFSAVVLVQQRTEPDDHAARPDRFLRHAECPPLLAPGCDQSLRLGLCAEPGTV
jgi:hypothetical protein